jgi:hypothetical protein
MELGDWILITAIILGILVGSGYLQAHNPGAASVVDSTWTKASVGAYDWVSGLFGQLKAGQPIAIANTTEGG